MSLRNNTVYLFLKINRLALMTKIYLFRTFLLSLFIFLVIVQDKHLVNTKLLEPLQLKLI